jgi:hypothetical protein
MTSRNWSIPIATGIVCLAAGMFIARGPGEPAAERPIQPADGRGAAHAPAGANFTLDDVRRVVREELAARERAANPAGDSTQRQAVADPPSGEQITAASQANATLQAAISRRAWTAADAEALRRDFDAMSPDQQAELMRTFSLAINQGRLVPDGEYLPF